MTEPSTSSMDFLKSLPSRHAKNFASAEKHAAILKHKLVRVVDVKVTSLERTIQNERDLSLLTALRHNWAQLSEADKSAESPSKASSHGNKRAQVSQDQPGPSRHANDANNQPPDPKHRRNS